MEQDIKQHTMVFGKGITSTPSDLLCDDDSLEVCDGMTLVDGEWKAIQRPEDMDVTVDGNLKLVHRVQGSVNYIYVHGTTAHVPVYDIYYKSGTESKKIGETFYCAINDIVAIGNTLVVSTENGLMYYLWSDAIKEGESYVSGYKTLGSNIPDFDIEFKMKNTNNVTAYGYSQLEMPEGVLIGNSGETGETDLFYLTSAVADDVVNAVRGLYAKNKNQIAKQNYFSNPFLVTAAIELYDGTFTMMSAPQLMLPVIHANSFMYLIKVGDADYYCRMTTMHGQLMYKLSADYSDWSDIVKNVVLFCTDDIEVNDLEITFDSTLSFQKYPMPYYRPDMGNDVYAESISEDDVSGSATEGLNIYRMWTLPTIPSGSSKAYKPFNGRKATDVYDDIKNKSNFYKLCELGIRDEGTSFHTTADKIKSHVVENLTTQQRLDTLEYYSRCSMCAGYMETFNRRLNIADVKRGFFKGFKHFLPIQDGNNHFYTCIVDIKTASGLKTVTHNFESKDVFYDGMWFYYPDPRAFHVVMKQGDTLIFEKDLEEHKGLNGAVCLSKLPDGTETMEAAETPSSGDSWTSSSPEQLHNYLLQSEVDNPFLFLASGYIRVGQGDVIGLAGLTTALSQDAYKVATTIAFTTQGIWALQIDSTGQYAQVNPPFSREVCSNADSITMTDNAVFFASAKGLMCVTGTTEAGVVCVSDALSENIEFMDFLNVCRIAYDYTDSMLLLFEREKADGWCYNMKSRIWSKTKGLIGDGNNFRCVVNDYPDNIIQEGLASGENHLYSLMNENYRKEDTNIYAGEMTTRAMKFEGSLILKSIRQIKHLKMLNNGTLSFKIEATNDLLEPTQEGVDKWHELSSVKGKAWRFFRFKYTFTGIKATDSFIGTTVVTQTKHTDKVR